MFDWTDRTASGRRCGPGRSGRWTTGSAAGPGRRRALPPVVTAFLHGWAQSTASASRWSRSSAGGGRPVHEIRDLIAATGPVRLPRAGLPLGRRCWTVLPDQEVPEAALPVVFTYDGPALSDPTNADIAAALGVPTTCEPGTYDVAIVGPGRPGWPRRSTPRPRACAPRCWSRRRSAGRPAAVADPQLPGLPARGDRRRAGGARDAAGRMFGTRIVYGSATGIATDGADHVVPWPAAPDHRPGGRRRDRRLLPAAGLPSLESSWGRGLLRRGRRGGAGVGADVYVVVGPTRPGRRPAPGRYAAQVTSWSGARVRRPCRTT